MLGGLGKEGDRFHTVTLRESDGDQVTVAETSTLAIFVAPKQCEIIEIGFMVTTTIVAHGSNFWTIQIQNQTGPVNLLSTAFDTDSGNSGNGGRALTADTFNSLTNDGTSGATPTPGTNYLQNAVLAKGDVLLLTATKDVSAADLKNPTVSIRYRV